jgi:alpha-amylase/alpha-mannosidase (GH57 family)
VSDPQPRVDLVLLWHHHQPDYRDPSDGRAQLPWVRLHATKDYLDMARRLERHSRVRCTFNFVPSLLDQLEQAGEGAGDALFDLLRKPVADLTPAERAVVRGRVTSAPSHAFDRWPAYRALTARSAMGSSDAAADDALLGLECWFLLAWLDPMFLEMPEAAAALAAPRFTAAHRDGLLTLHDRLLRDVVPAYRDLAARAQVELSASAYFHPILPLLIDNAAARRSRPDARLPEEPFAFPEDADRQIARALDRHARVFGARPRGMWPPEGSVSPEAIERLARAGVAWAASDEGVLWASLDTSARRRDALYRPWRLETGAGAVMLLFRDRELSDRIGFVYQNWNAAAAAEDFVTRLKRIGDDHGATLPATVCVALDGENCWEHYADDGGPFLEALYTAIAAAPEIRTLTPSDVVDSGREVATLARLHSGSWIDADFHIWIGHPEKNRAWDLIARTRRALVQAGTSPESAPTAWEALDTAEGSDWFWWLGEDHFTPDKALFDQLFRAQLRAAHERADLPAPAWLDAPIARPSQAAGAGREPFGFVRPTLDGRRTGYYEWHGAARFVLGAGGGSMHRGVGRARELHVGFDAERLYVRVDFDDQGAPGKEWDLVLELAAPVQARLVARRLAAGEGAVERDGAGGPPVPLAGARWVLDAILEMSIPFASMGVASGQTLELVARLTNSGAVVETLPADDVVRLRVPSAADEARSWSA